ncbi:hypothetical protein BJF93_05905 [Xaviernesmea oryzae]|uniref:Uncharacterized protein n=1 Tax=Xaviernesmea oryzae TaxID=464029 RepID=A0A1Q9ARZ6_9HYPH|nr:hypothetical protein BJF93_05905 [Xaviernesmea oryzae]
MLFSIAEVAILIDIALFASIYVRQLPVRLAAHSLLTDDGDAVRCAEKLRFRHSRPCTVTQACGAVMHQLFRRHFKGSRPFQGA